jgi:hypothetical protein
MKRRSSWRVKLSCGLTASLFSTFLLLFSNASCLNAQTNDSEKGFVLSETFQGSSNEIGTILKLDTMTGYKFNRHFELDAGIPFYFVNASPESTAAGATSGNGIGNAYLRLRFAAANSTATFISSLTGSAPTGDSDRGFSTGRATVDWNNYLGFNAGKLSPFVNIGLANSISDTAFFTRPFTSLGKVAHFEGGTDIQLLRMVSVGASAYADTPFGDQKVYSKLVVHGQQNAPGQGNGMGMGRGHKSGVFQNQSVTVGSADITRDNGGSVWLDINPPGALNFEVGYSRSAEYDLNSLFFSVRMNLGHFFRSRH